MVLCAAALAVLGVLWIFGRTRLPPGSGKLMGILAAAAALGIALGFRERDGQVLTGDGLLKRKEAGQGSYTEELELSAEGLLDGYSYQVEVPERVMTEEEEQECIAAAKAEIEEEFPGENESVNQIREKVSVRDSYQNGLVDAEWSFGDSGIMNLFGEVVAEDLPEEGALVEARVSLECGTSSATETFYFKVFPAILDEDAAFLAELEKNLARQGEEAGAEYLELPQEILGHAVEWRKEKEHLPEEIFLLGGVIAFLLPFVEQSREKERQKKREELLTLEYPDMVSKLALLLGAGMTVQRAFQKIAFSYEKKRMDRTAGEMPAYEEMLITCREVESGIGEEKAYERFGERCGLAAYRKLGSILAQNIRKGSRGLTALLEKEAENAFEERKSMAKRYGEEAGTKLLLPMMLMLGMIMVILMVPAVLSFQI